MDSLREIPVVVGPTAAGKSAWALALAHAQDAVLLSADARQIYRGMDIGTNKPSAAEQAAVPHFGIDLLTPDEPYSAARYADYALSVIAAHPRVVVVGGTGLYLRALAGGLDAVPPTPAPVRAQLEARLAAEGLPALVAELQHADPVTYARIDRRNPARVLRALAVYHSTGQPLSDFQTGVVQARPFRLRWLGLAPPREALYRRIDARVLAMLDQGLLAEADALLARYGPDAPGLQAIGYRELMDWRLGRYPSLEVAVAKIQQHTRNYAKRQLTWFRRVPDVAWYDAPPGLPST